MPPRSSTPTAAARRSSSSTSARPPGSARSRCSLTIVTAGATSGDDARFDVTYQFVKQARVLGSRLGDMDDALAAAKQLSAGRFRPLVGARLPLEEIGEAHRLLETGDVAGKIVVTFD